MSDHAIQLETPRDYNTFSDNNINKLGDDLSGLRNLTELNAKKKISK